MSGKTTVDATKIAETLGAEHVGPASAKGGYFGALQLAANMTLPRCPECGGTVRLSAGTGRTREIRRGVTRSIPDDFEIPTCTGCGEVCMIPEVSEPLDRLLEE